jgi:aminoglycoside phosphotransferase (APT) family kinase protein
LTASAVTAVSAEEVAALLGGGDVRDLARMLGGASRETWSFSYDGRPLVLRRDPPGSPRSGGLPREAALMTAARAAGLPVPEIVAAAADCLVMTRVYGETLARRILRDESYSAARAALTSQCAKTLALLHIGVTPDVAPDLPGETDPVQTLRDALDRIGRPRPALELGLRRLESTRPPARAAVVVHGDFRLGNLVVDPGGLVGVLDWELAHLGDPVEDLGWLCVRSWRFGGPQPVAGVGSREELLSSYEAAGGGRVSLDELAWWELHGTIRWAVICAEQAAAHLSGATRSIELAAIGRRTAEVELDVLELLGPELVAKTIGSQVGAERPTAAGPGGDRPSAAELIEAVDEWVGALDLEGHQAFEARVARGVLRLVGRELELGPGVADAHARRLAELGVADDAMLARQIRAGREGADVVAALVATAVDKVRVADPRQLAR